MVDTSNTSATDRRDVMREKLRTTLLDKRLALTTAQQQAAATALLLQLKRCLAVLKTTDKSSGYVAGYLASRGEIDVLPALDWLRQCGYQTVLPVISVINNSPGLLFAPFDQQTPLKPGKFNIPIPDIPSSDYKTASDLDLVLVPLVGFDAAGGRLGMGGGYYDRTFAFRQDTSAKKLKTKNVMHQAFVGVAHECQQVDEIPTENWDVRLQAVATDRTCYYPEA